MSFINNPLDTDIMSMKHFFAQKNQWRFVVQIVEPHGLKPSSTKIVFTNRKIHDAKFCLKNICLFRLKPLYLRSTWIFFPPSKFRRVIPESIVSWSRSVGTIGSEPVGDWSSVIAKIGRHRHLTVESAAVRRRSAHHWIEQVSANGPFKRGTTSAYGCGESVGSDRARVESVAAHHSWWRGRRCRRCKRSAKHSIRSSEVRQLLLLLLLLLFRSISWTEIERVSAGHATRVWIETSWWQKSATSTAAHPIAKSTKVTEVHTTAVLAGGGKVLEHALRRFCDLARAGSLKRPWTRS